MRLDKYLKVSRLIKRRTVAKDACDAERLELNGKTAKGATQVKPGDIIVIRYGDKCVKAKIVAVMENVRKENAADMYEIIAE